MITQELDDDQLKVIERVEKLLRLAGANPNEAEAASATAKAMELLAAYNLDLGMVGENAEKDTKREELATRGGAYVYQRDLWSAVAALNFCVYWNMRKHVVWVRKDTTKNKHRYPYHHCFIGRVVNVIATRTMAEYLETTIERIMRERLKDQVTGIVPHNQLFSRWAISYRSGAADRVVQKLNERRWDREDEERREKAEAKERAARAGVSTSTSITLSSYTKSERQANIDALNDARYGAGWSAKQAEERARQAKAAREAEEEYTRWAAANPEEAKKEEEKARKAREEFSKKRSKRDRAYVDREAQKEARRKANQDGGAYWSGWDAAESISIDQQVSDGKSVKKIADGRW